MKIGKLNLVFSGILDYIFPLYCLSCKKEGSFLCQNCQIKIINVKTQVCSQCGRISNLGRTCSKCRQKFPTRLNGIIAAAYYEEGPIKELIHNLKYNQMTNLAPVLGKLMAEALVGQEEILKDNPILVPVPMYRFKKAQRGYNQAELLAKSVFENVCEKYPKISFNPKILLKAHPTIAQVKTRGDKRRKNLENVFRVSVRDRKLKFVLRYPADQALACSLKGKSIVLIDDVSTTGTTLNECAKVLKEAGAKKVWGLVVARG